MLIKKSIFRSHGDLSWGFQASEEATASGVSRMVLVFVGKCWSSDILLLFATQMKDGALTLTKSPLHFFRSFTFEFELKAALDWSPFLNGTEATQAVSQWLFATHPLSFPLFMMCFLRQCLEPWGVLLSVFFSRKSPLERDEPHTLEGLFSSAFGEKQMSS